MGCLGACLDEVEGLQRYGRQRAGDKPGRDRRDDEHESADAGTFPRVRSSGAASFVATHTQQHVVVARSRSQVRVHGLARRLPRVMGACMGCLTRRFLLHARWNSGSLSDTLAATCSTPRLLLSSFVLP